MVKPYGSPHLLSKRVIVFCTTMRYENAYMTEKRKAHGAVCADGSSREKRSGVKGVSA